MKKTLLFLSLLFSIVHITGNTTESTSNKAPTNPNAFTVKGDISIVNNSTDGTIFLTGEAHGFTSFDLPFNSSPEASVKVGPTKTVTKPFSLVYTQDPNQKSNPLIHLQGTLKFSNNDMGVVGCDYIFEVHDDQTVIRAKSDSIGLQCHINHQGTITINKENIHKGVLDQALNLSMTIPEV